MRTVQRLGPLGEGRQSCPAFLLLPPAPLPAPPARSTLQFDPPEPPLRLSSAFVDLVARLPALEVLEVLEEAAFDRPTQLPASWAGLTRLRRLFVNQVAFNGSLPSAWGAKNAFPSLQHLCVAAAVPKATLACLSWLAAT